MSGVEHLPQPGLPDEPLPAGERILWQGRPDWRALAARSFHTRAVGVYFGLLLVWHVAAAVIDGSELEATAISALSLVLLGVAAVAILSVLAWLSARSSVYTITNRRVILQIGVALPLTFNVPFRKIGTAAFKAYQDGSGDIPLTIADGSNRIAFLILWPHARPWRVKTPEPMLRAVPDAMRVAEILKDALAEAAQSPANIPEIGEEKTARPITHAPVAA